MQKKLAPFFLPTLPGSEGSKFAEMETAATTENTQPSNTQSRILNFGNLDMRTKFMKAVEAGYLNNDCTPVSADYLRSYSCDS